MSHLFGLRIEGSETEILSATKNTVATCGNLLILHNFKLYLKEFLTFRKNLQLATKPICVFLRLTKPNWVCIIPNMTPIHPPKKHAEKRAWIKYQLELRGYSFASLARELGVDRTVPQSALRRKYPKMERAIADKIGLAPEEIWPERYPSGVQVTRKRKVRQ